MTTPIPKPNKDMHSFMNDSIEFVIEEGEYVVADPCAMLEESEKKWYDEQIACQSDVANIYMLQKHKGMTSVRAFNGDGRYELLCISKDGEESTCVIAVDTASVAIIPSDKLHHQYYDPSSVEYKYCESTRVKLKAPLNVKIFKGLLNLVDNEGNSWQVNLGEPSLTCQEVRHN